MLSKEYFIGYDPVGYDGRTGTLCVMARMEEGSMVVEQFQSRNKEEFEKELERVSVYYNTEPHKFE